MATKKSSKKLHIVYETKLPEARFQKYVASLKLETNSTYENWCRANGFSASKRKGWQDRLVEAQVAKRKRSEEQAQSQFQRHLKSLRLSEEEYESWRRIHGFAGGIRKSEERKEKELEVRGREWTQQSLQYSRTRHSHPARMILSLSRNEPISQSTNADIFHSIQSNFKQFQKQRKIHADFTRLLLHVERVSDLLSGSQLFPGGANDYEGLINALATLATQSKSWIRPLENWRPKVRNIRRQFHSLANHLLCEYETPMFMDAAWSEPNSAEGELHREWYLHIGRGQNLRTANTPVELTKMMARFITMAPSTLTIPQAIRWGQVRGMGGNERLAGEIVGSRMRNFLPDEPFWTTVLHFFKNNPALTGAHINSIADYLYYQKFVPQDRICGEGSLEEIGAPFPNLSMKGRTAAALLRLAEEWRNTMALQTSLATSQWKSANVPGYALLENDENGAAVRHWAVEELVNGKQLHAEGKYMHNCVASYFSSCLNGQSSIWSLRVRSASSNKLKTVMTIEMEIRNQTRTLVQVKGRFNRRIETCDENPLMKKAIPILLHWAENRDVKIGKNVVG